MNETLRYNTVSNRSLKHKGVGSKTGGMGLEGRVSRHESRGTSLKVTYHKITEEGNICI